MKVCYFTSKSDDDIRVFHKECMSLNRNGYKVTIVTPNALIRIKNGIKIESFKYENSSFINRVVWLPYKLYKNAVKLNADIYHFNDPACLPYALFLKIKNKKVIFDSFEDHPTLILQKKLPSIINRIIAKLYTIFEFIIVTQLDGIIGCYHWTIDRYAKTKIHKELIFNFPEIKDETFEKFPKRYKKPNRLKVCYTGLISPMWKIESILDAVGEMKNYVTLVIAGNASENYLEKLRSNKYWNENSYIGMLKRNEVINTVYRKSDIGIALLDYIPLCKGTIGNLSNNKLFEYLLNGLPVICTDFILWKEIVEKYNCGICVNPNNVNEIVAAIKYLLNNPEKTKQMGKNGQKIIREKYNWEFEEKKLIEFYKNVRD